MIDMNSNLLTLLIPTPVLVNGLPKGPTFSIEIGAVGAAGG
jgi:hypothetical protein